MELPFSGALFLFPTLCKLAPNFTGYKKYLEAHDILFTMLRETYEEHKTSFQVGQPRDYLDSYLEEILASEDPSSSFYGIEGGS